MEPERDTMHRRTPDRRLRGLLARDYVGIAQRSATVVDWLQPPVARASLIVTLEGPVSVDGHALPSAWLGGLGGSCGSVRLPPTHTSLDVKLHPLGAYALCGRSLAELEGGYAPLEEVFGTGGRELEARLQETRGWPARFDLLDAFLVRRAAVSQGSLPPHPLVRQAWRRLRERRGVIRIASLAAELGCSRRHLSALFAEQVGLAPKTVARLVRFEHLCRQVTERPDGWADLAYAYGYADQAHLNRDFRELGGTTPTAFVAAAQHAGRLSFLQDGHGDDA